MRAYLRRSKPVSDAEDPRDTQIRELQAALKVAQGDVANHTQTISKSEMNMANSLGEIRVLKDKIDGYEQKTASAMEGMEREIVEKNHAREELAQARAEIETLTSRLQEMELEHSISDSGAMLDAAHLTSEEDTPGQAEQIESLEHEVQRWQRHCRVLGEELKSQREKTQKALLEAAQSTPAHSSTDQLSEIRGIGTVLERKLNQLGIRRFQELAEISPEEMKQASVLIPDLKARLRRYDWIDQARNLHMQKYAQGSQATNRR